MTKKIILLSTKSEEGKQKESPKKTKSKRNEYEQLEWERLFGSNIDHYMAMNRCLILSRIFHKVGPQDVYDDDIWNSVSPYIKGDEFQELLDELIPSKSRQAEFIDDNTGGYRRRNRSRENSELLEALYKDIANRNIIWEVLAGIMDKRVEEYNAIINSKNFHKLAFQQRVEELQKYLSLDDHERDILLVFFMEESDNIKLGDFAVSTYRNSFNTRKLAIAAGIDECLVGIYLSDKANLHKYGIMDEDGDLNRSFMSFLVGTSTQALSERFWTKSTEEALPWEYHGKIAEEHGKIISEMVNYI